MNTQKGFTPLGFILIGATTVLIVGVLAFAFNKGQPETGPVPPGVAKITIDETFEITLPGGWKKQAPPSGVYAPTENYEDGAVHYYGDSTGNFFVVHVDPPSRDFASDISWGLGASGRGYKVINEEPQCEAKEVFCSAGNNKLELGMTTDSQPLNGHTYFFFAGNTQRETGVDTKVFKDILSSFRSK